MSTAQAQGTGLSMPQAAGGDWFNNILNVLGSGYVLHENRKFEEAKMRQDALLAQAELADQPQYSNQAVSAPGSQEQQWINGVNNSTVLMAGGVILLSALLMK